MRRIARAAAAALTVLAVATPVSLLAAPASAATTYDDPVEPYAAYQPQRTCRDTPRAGTRELATWIDATYGGGAALASIRACDSGGASEHKAGRAIDWMIDVTDRAQRREARSFLREAFATDVDGNPHALARRMGIMYVIWNDHMWASYDHFGRKDYLNGACSSLAKCSVTLRHRDHVHLSLSGRGSRGLTSWYERS
jgi:hypothetical protein